MVNSVNNINSQSQYKPNYGIIALAAAGGTIGSCAYAVNQFCDKNVAQTLMKKNRTDLTSAQWLTDLQASINPEQAWELYNNDSITDDGMKFISDLSGNISDTKRDSFRLNELSEISLASKSREKAVKCLNLSKKNLENYYSIMTEDFKTLLNNFGILDKTKWDNALKQKEQQLKEIAKLDRKNLMIKAGTGMLAGAAIGFLIDIVSKRLLNPKQHNTNQ